MQETNVTEHGQAIRAVATEITPAGASTMTLCSYGNMLTREELARVKTPAGTAAHKPIPHITVVEKLVEALSFRQIGVVREEYAVSSDGMKMFGVMDLSSGFDGCRFAIGLRNSHDKSFRPSCTVGLRVFVSENLAFHGEFTPVLAKHSKHFSLEDSLAILYTYINRTPAVWLDPILSSAEVRWQGLLFEQHSSEIPHVVDFPDHFSTSRITTHPATEWQVEPEPAFVTWDI